MIERNEKNYLEILDLIKPRLAELLLSGYSIEISQSRGGIKMSRITKKYEIVPNYVFDKQGNNQKRNGGDR